MIEFSNTIKNFKTFLDFNITHVLCGNLDKKLCETQQQLMRLNKTYTDTVERLQTLIVEIRKNRSKIISYDQTLTNLKDKMLKNIKEFIQLVKHLEEKGQLINSLKKQNFEYCNAAERHVSKKDNNETLIQKLTINKQ